MRSNQSIGKMMMAIMGATSFRFLIVRVRFCPESGSPVLWRLPSHTIWLAKMTINGKMEGTRYLGYQRLESTVNNAIGISATTIKNKSDRRRGSNRLARMPMTKSNRAGSRK